MPSASLSALAASAWAQCATGEYVDAIRRVAGRAYRSAYSAISDVRLSQALVSFSAETGSGLTSDSINFGSYADALTGMGITDIAPGDALPIPEITNFVVGDQSIDIAWKAFEDLGGGYARTPDNWQVRIRNRGASSLLLLRETFELSVTSAQLSLALDAGTYNTELFLREGFGSFEGFSYSTRSRFTMPFDRASVPEPAITALLALGLFGVGAVARRRSN